MLSVRTRFLKVKVIQGGPKSGIPVLLLHGWPDDATTWDHVSPHLHKAGLGTLAPMQRGFGGMRFLSNHTRRTGNMGVLCLDTIDLMDALEINPFFVAGHDWGSNIAEALALGWPRRVTRIAILSTPSRLGGLQMPPLDMARLYWYQWFQATKRGTKAVAEDPKTFARIMWETWSPPGWFDERNFRTVAASFTNPDWATVTTHLYRSRWGEAGLDRRSLRIEAKIKATRRLQTPTLFIHGVPDGVQPPGMSDNMREKFAGPFGRICLDGVGHFPTREASELLGKKLVEHFWKKLRTPSKPDQENGCRS
jgi:pimeloyl-ACP methyl ester carboxylesterase